MPDGHPRQTPPRAAIASLAVYASVPWLDLRPILYNPHRDVWAYRALKSSFVVICRIRLNISEPHLCLADFTKRTTDDPLLRKCLIFSHATTFCVVGVAYARTERLNKKEPASGLARLISTNRGSRPRLFMRVIDNCASKFRLPFEFDRNVAARFPPVPLAGADCYPHQRTPLFASWRRPRRRLHILFAPPASAVGVSRHHICHAECNTGPSLPRLA